ncbi:hypothetical protein [Paracoccus marcusii]|uniref:hypothetical protein n=1 Tax=Paracoccus marcusii TaxID=59779 RepID=UPI003266BB87
MAPFERWHSSTMQVHGTCEAPHQDNAITTESETAWAKRRRVAATMHRLKIACNRLGLTNRRSVRGMAQRRRLAPSIDLACLRFLSGVQRLFGMPPDPHGINGNAYNIRIYPGVVSGFDSVVKAPDGTSKGCHHATMEAALQAAFAVEGMPVGQPAFIYARSLLDLMTEAVVPAPGAVSKGGAS